MLYIFKTQYHGHIIPTIFRYLYKVKELKTSSSNSDLETSKLKIFQLYLLNITYVIKSIILI